MKGASQRLVEAGSTASYQQDVRHCAATDMLSLPRSGTGSGSPSKACLGRTRPMPIQCFHGCLGPLRGSHPALTFRSMLFGHEQHHTHLRFPPDY